MALHLLEPHRVTLHGQFSRTLAPALEVDSGDTVRYHTLDMAWRTTGKMARHAQSSNPGNSRAMPVLVSWGPSWCAGGAGQRPGDPYRGGRTYRVRWTLTGDIGTFSAALNRALGITDGSQHVVRWRLDSDAMIATSQGDHRVRLRPFLGTVRLALAAPGWHEAWPPRLTVGNLDCKELVAGSTLYLPVAVPGALVSVGDGHAAQGDGEAGGTAIECPIDRVDLRYVVRNDLAFDAPRAHTPAG